MDKMIGFKLETVQKFTQAGQRIPVTQVKVESKVDLKPGDKVKVTGWSKGKGFTGVMKRWGFKGGPRTHGQSDRQRAPGSIGQSTTPGRVFPGKKMAGRAGGARVTILGLTVMGIDEANQLLLIKGLVPGPRNGRLVIRKMGEEKNFVPLLSSALKVETKPTEKKEQPKPKTDNQTEKKSDQEENNAKD